MALLVPLLSLAVAVAYAAMLRRLGAGWVSIITPAEPKEGPSVTVVVAARNEEQHIGRCLTSLMAQGYPASLLRIMVADDGSEDSTASVAEKAATSDPRITVLRPTGGEGKKHALSAAIHASDSDLIATVDADCEAPPGWLAAMVAQLLAEDAEMVLGPVTLSPTPTFFGRIQALEFLAIMGVTGGAAALGHPVMANGANLLLRREAFHRAGGYSGSSNPSGDDVFLMLKLAQEGAGKVTFCRNPAAVVRTPPVPTLGPFIQQRKRWLSKRGGYSDRHVRHTALLTYSANALGLVAAVGAAAASGPAATVFFLSLLIKTAADAMLIHLIRRDLQPEAPYWPIILPAQVFVLGYVTLLGIFGNVRSYEWKGRKVTVTE